MNWGVSIKNSKKTENNIFKEFGFVIEALRKKIKGGLYIRTTCTKCADKIYIYLDNNKCQYTVQ